jgi:flagellar motor switch protein FliN/FliY
MSRQQQQAGANLSVLLDIELPVALRLGRKLMSLEDILSLSDGSAIEFDRAPDDPVEVLVNGRVVARGEAVLVKGNYGVRISEITSSQDRLNATDGLSHILNGVKS